MTWSYFFSILPFLHILIPSYILTAERYLYTPIAMLIFSIAIIFERIIFAKKQIYIFSILFISILILSSARTYTRTLDWKDNYTFINSAYEPLKDPFYKAIKLGMYASTIKEFEKYNKEKSKELYRKVLNFLLDAKTDAVKNKETVDHKLPLILKTYGLDFNSRLSKIAFLEASVRSSELGESTEVGINILKPYLNNLTTLEPRAIELYSRFLILDKKYDEAEKLLTKVELTYPDLIVYKMTLFDYFMHINQKEKAEKYVLDSLKRFPYDTNALYKTFAYYYDTGNKEKTAHFAYLYGLRVQSKLGYKEALRNYLKLNDLSNANKCINKLLKIDPEDAESLYLISEYYYKSNNYKKALSYIEDAYSRSIKTVPDAKLVFNIGNTLCMLYIESGRTNDAIIPSQNILKFANNDLESLKKLAKLLPH
jgi:tetratricopeptide (TPR) repeat protein